MSESFREKAKRHPRLVNRLLAGGLLVSLMLTLGMAFLLQSQQYTTNQMATRMALAQATLDYENAALRSQRLVSHARSLAEDGQVNLALAFALEAVEMPNPPLEAQRLLWDLMQMPAVERLIVGDNEKFLRDVGIVDEEMILYDSDERTFISLSLDTGEQKALSNLDAGIEVDFYPLNASWGVIDGPPCVLTDIATFKMRIPMETCLAEVKYDFSLDGRYFVLSENYGKTHLYDLETGNHRLLLEDSLLYPRRFQSRFKGVYLTARRNLYTSNEQPPVALYLPVDGEPQPLLAIEKAMRPMTGTFLARSRSQGMYVLIGSDLKFWQQGYLSTSSQTLARQYSVRDFVSNPQGDKLIMTEMYVGPGCCTRSDAHLVNLIWGMSPDFTVTRLNMLGGSVHFSDDGKRAVITGIDYPMDVSDRRNFDTYSLSNNTAILAVEPPPPEPLAVIPGNYHILSFDEQDLIVWRSNEDGTSALMRLVAPDWQPAWEYTPEFTVYHAVYGGQRQILLVGMAGEVQILGAVSGKVLNEWQASFKQLRTAALNPQGTQVALLSSVPYNSPDPAKLYLHEAASGALQAEVELPAAYVFTILYSPDGQLLWLNGQLYDSAGTLVREFPPEKARYVRGDLTTFVPEENAVLVVDVNGNFIKFDLATGEVIDERPFDRSVSGGVIDLAQQRVILETGWNQIVVTTLDSLYTLQSWEAGDVGAVKGDLVAATRDNALLLWRIESVAELAERVRTTRHIPEIPCTSDAIYRDIAGCN